MWDLNYYLDPDPNGYFWIYSETIKSFPEFGELVHSITKCVDKNEEVESRIKVLKTCIKLLEK